MMDRHEAERIVLSQPPHILEAFFTLISMMGSEMFIGFINGITQTRDFKVDDAPNTDN